MRVILLLAVVAVVLARGANAVTNPPVDAFVEEYNGWMEENKIQLPSVRLAEFPRFGYGMKATRDIGKGDLLASVPMSAFLFGNDYRNGLLKPLAEELPGVNDHMMTALGLVAERNNPDGKLKPWINSLPTKYGSTLYFSDDEMSELQGSTLAAETRARLRNIKETYDVISEVLFRTVPSRFTPDTFTLEDYKWAMLIVMGRSYTFSGDAGPIASLVPGLDAFNYDDSEVTTKYNNETNTFEVFAGKDTAAGEQVMVNFGRKYNIDLLLLQGHIHDAEEFDAVVLSTKMEGNDTNREFKQTVMARKGLQWEGSHYVNRAGPSEKLLASLRIQLAQGNDLLEVARVDGGPVSLENELEVYRNLLIACETMVNGYNTTIEEDRSKLQKDLPQNIHNAIRLRLGEKEVLRATAVKVMTMWRDILLRGFSPARPEQSKENEATWQGDE